MEIIDLGAARMQPERVCRRVVEVVDLPFLREAAARTAEGGRPFRVAVLEDPRRELRSVPQAARSIQPIGPDRIVAGIVPPPGERNFGRYNRALSQVRREVGRNGRHSRLG